MVKRNGSTGNRRVSGKSKRVLDMGSNFAIIAVIIAVALTWQKTQSIALTVVVGVAVFALASVEIVKSLARVAIELIRAVRDVVQRIIWSRAVMYQQYQLTERERIKAHRAIATYQASGNAAIVRAAARNSIQRTRDESRMIEQQEANTIELDEWLDAQYNVVEER